MKKVVLTTIAVVIAAVAAQAQSVRADVGMMAYILPKNNTAKNATLNKKVEKAVVKAQQTTAASTKQDAAQQGEVKTAPAKKANADQAQKKKTASERAVVREQVTAWAATQPVK